MPRAFPVRRVYHLQLSDGRPLVLGERCLVMGILNVTPDSFAGTAPFVGGDGAVDADRAIDAALAMAGAGADLIDVGGESTRPGAEPVPAGVELARVVPIVRRLAMQLTVPISIDTSKAEVARAALDAGASLINDISGLQYDAALASVAAERSAPVVLMHMRGRPATMDAEAQYEDVVTEVVAELRQAIGRATGAGVPRDQLLVDPGIGFAKRPAHSYGVLARLADIGAALDRPLVLGASRKSFMREALGARPPAERDWGTAAAVTAAVLAGAHVVRVHAVDAMAQVVRVAEDIRRNA